MRAAAAFAEAVTALAHKGGHPMGAFQDLSGLRFGRLVVIAVSIFRYHGEGGNIVWLCRCDCGTEKGISSNSLKTGSTKSCGCLRRAATKKRSTTHGQTKIRNGIPSYEYMIWQNMLRRCYDPTNRRYHRYGARGITVCARWRKSFAAFFADMGSRPPGMNGKRALFSIDRIDNNRGYSKKNCRWTTNIEQCRNR
jgi:hypothetical protein